MEMTRRRRQICWKYFNNKFLLSQIGNGDICRSENNKNCLFICSSLFFVLSNKSTHTEVPGTFYMKSLIYNLPWFLSHRVYIPSRNLINVCKKKKYKFGSQILEVNKNLLHKSPRLLISIKNKSFRFSVVWFHLCIVCVY